MDSLSLDELKQQLRTTGSTIGYEKFFEGDDVNDEAFYLSLQSFYKRGFNLCQEITKRLKNKKQERANV